MDMFEDTGDYDDYDYEPEEIYGESMYIKLHGGACCGIKHIHEMGYHPDEVLAARLAKTGDETSFGRYHHNGVNDAHADTYPEDFFNDEAPKETRAERLARLLEFLKKHRPHGIVEIVLVSNQHQWYHTLEGHGFKKVTEAKNSNTSNQLRVFHLAY